MSSNLAYRGKTDSFIISLTHYRRYHHHPYCYYFRGHARVTREGENPTIGFTVPLRYLPGTHRSIGFPISRTVRSSPREFPERRRLCAQWKSAWCALVKETTRSAGRRRGSSTVWSNTITRTNVSPVYTVRQRVSGVHTLVMK